MVIKVYLRIRLLQSRTACNDSPFERLGKLDNDTSDVTLRTRSDPLLSASGSLSRSGVFFRIMLDCLVALCFTSDSSIFCAGWNGKAGKEHTSLASTPAERNMAQKSWAPMSREALSLRAALRKSESCVGRSMSSGGCN